jgi:hypothetical protein
MVRRPHVCWQRKSSPSLTDLHYEGFVMQDTAALQTAMQPFVKLRQAYMELISKFSMSPEVTSQAIHDAQAIFQQAQESAEAEPIARRCGPNPRSDEELHRVLDRDEPQRCRDDGKRSGNPSFVVSLKLRTLCLGNQRTSEVEHGSTGDGALPGTGSGVSGLRSEGEGMGRGERHSDACAGKLVRAFATLAGEA